MKNALKAAFLTGTVFFGISLQALEPGKSVKLKISKPEKNKSTQAYFSFDNLKNGVFKNESGNKHTYIGDAKSNNAQAVKGVFGKALNTQEKTSIQAPQRARETAALTIEFYLNPGKTPNHTILLNTLNEKKDKGWELSLSRENMLKWTVCHKNGAKTIIRTNRKVPSGKWSKIAVTFGSIPGQGGVKGYRIYIDGYVAAEIANFASIWDSTGNLTIKTPPDGAIDELSISLANRDIYPDIEISDLPPANMDFEKGAKGWVGVYDNCKIDKETKHSGKNSLKIETNDVYTREYLSPMFNVEPGATYLVSFWAKVGKFEKGYSAIGVWIRWYFEPEETCSYGGDLVAHCLKDKGTGTFDWKKFEAKITVPDKKEQRKKIHWARLQVKNYHSNVTAWIDDIKIIKDKAAKGGK